MGKLNKKYVHGFGKGRTFRDDPDMVEVAPGRFRLRSDLAKHVAADPEESRRRNRRKFGGGRIQLPGMDREVMLPDNKKAAEGVLRSHIAKHCPQMGDADKIEFRGGIFE